MGGQLGNDTVHKAAFEELCATVQSLHEAIDEIGDPATEFVLKKNVQISVSAHMLCASMVTACRVMHYAATRRSYAIA